MMMFKNIFDVLDTHLRMSESDNCCVRVWFLPDVQA